jgi:VWFA-related protein
VPADRLTEGDFTILDNGVPQELASFRSSSDSADVNAELSEVVLVLDQVNLSPVQFDIAKHGIVQFLRQNGGRLDHRMSIYWFKSMGLYATATPTTDGNVLADEIDHGSLPRVLWEIPPPLTGDIQAIADLRGIQWDSALRTVYTIAIEHREEPGRKVLLWVGYGWPLDTGYFHNVETAFESLVELSTRLQEARVVICQIPPPVDPSKVSPQVFNFDYPSYVAGVHSLSELKKQFPNPFFALQVLAIQSGGLVLNKYSPIENEIQRSIQYASKFYTLSFDPPRASQPDEYHGLKVQMKAPGLTASTSTGYYNQPDFFDQPRIPSRLVTARELEQMLESSSKDQDGALAGRLSGLALTERVSRIDLSVWRDRLRGKKSKAALTTLVDEAAFLRPAQSLLVADQAPGPEEQHQILAQVAEYLKDALPRLPDFFATRTTVQYEQPAPTENDGWNSALPDQALHEAVTEKATLRYRKGREEQDEKKRRGSSAAKRSTLNLIGTFGPILNSLFADVTRSDNTLTWSRWERGEQGKVAVFHYEVRGRSQFYAISHCCLKGAKVWRTAPHYFGELWITPSTGAILRFTMESEPGWILEPNLHPVQPIRRTSTMVEYAPVEISGRSYICPVRGVVITRSRPVRRLTFWDESFETYAAYATLLDDIAYSNYHKFGSELRILPDFEVVPNASTPN